ncbi:MAG: hypothetical protein HOE90_05285 [Bacteriovoracaceae bacterium]|jgi:tetratricopeptide (TPR) repeat protein|nr:hypothetical protein [Bacteriovoracaceae bacterium]
MDSRDELKIQRPRLGVLKQKNIKGAVIPSFSLDEKDFASSSLKEKILPKILNFEDQKSIKYIRLIKQGHKHVLSKNHNLALEMFERANKIKQTTKTLSLISWVHSLKGDLEQAKAICFKAIELNPEQGTPYNDMGSFLLQDSKYHEALDWFKKAKSAKFATNREYPYINSARAYLQLKQYRKALSEFKKAVEFVPYQKDLHEIILKLKYRLKFSKEGPGLDFQGRLD